MSDDAAVDPGTADLIAYQGLIELLHWEHTSNSGTRIKLALMGLDELDHFERATKRTKRRAGQRYMAVWQSAEGVALEQMPSELWFAGASWNHSAGAVVVFTINPEDLDVFMGMTARDSGTAEHGSRLYMALVELDADEEPVNQRQRDLVEALRPEPVKGGPISKNAGMICQDQQFQRFLQAKFQTKCQDAETAGDLVRQYCQIDSRAMLDHDPGAREHYEELKREFVRWGRRYG